MSKVGKTLAQDEYKNQKWVGFWLFRPEIGQELDMEQIGPPL